MDEILLAHSCHKFSNPARLASPLKYFIILFVCASRSWTHKKTKKKSITAKHFMRITFYCAFFHLPLWALLNPPPPTFPLPTEDHFFHEMMMQMFRGAWRQNPFRLLLKSFLPSPHLCEGLSLRPLATRRTIGWWSEGVDIALKPWFCPSSYVISGRGSKLTQKGRLRRFLSYWPGFQTGIHLHTRAAAGSFRFLLKKREKKLQRQPT